MAGNPDYDQLISTTIKHYVPRLEDQVFSSKPLLWAIRAAGRIQNLTGTHIVVPLMYAEVSNKGSYSGSDVFTTDAETGINAAEFPWKQYYALVSFEGIELARNSGPEAVLSLLRARLQQAELTIAENLDEMFLSDGSGNGEKDWYGLEAIIDSSDPSWGDFGGIDRGTNTWWQAQENAEGGVLELSTMIDTYLDASEGNDQPGLVLTTQDGFREYEELITSQIRYEDPSMGDASFQTLMFKDAPVTFDRNVTAQTMYFVNMKYITLAKLNNVWFSQSEFLEPANQDVRYKKILSYGNLVASNCKRQGKITGITNA